MPHSCSSGRSTFGNVFIALLVASFMLALPLAAQVTTGSLTGVVIGADGSALPGVTVEAVHVPTGTHYSTVTGSNGRFTVPNVRVGGPYTVTANLEGFKPFNTKNLEVSLGEATEVPVTLQLATVSEAITVTARADEVINPNHTGSTSQVSEEQIQTLPTVNRQIQDFARTNPYVNSSLTGDGTFMFIAGRNNRYNTIQIDGAVNNDLFGLSAAGTPGGGSGTQPISLDSVQQIQVAVSPYDVRQSGFTGGGVNVVTRSGTNKLEGSVFGTKRDPSFVGKGPFNTSVRDFDQSQYGGRIGGPILRDKLFFFLSGESNKLNNPDDTSADPNAGTGTVYNNANPNAADVAAFLKSKYNFDPGSLGDLTFHTKSDLIFGRLDSNIGAAHNLTLRHNYVSATNDNPPSSFSRTSTRFYFPTNIYKFPSKTNSTVAQLNSVFNANSYNEARVNVTKVREHRETPVIFPTIELGPGGERSGTLQTGIERFSGANALNQDITEITDDYTMIHGSHTLILGTHNEFFKFANTFIQDFYGYYHFASFDTFKAGTPDIYRIGFATGDDPKRPTQFKAGQYSLYANDQWRLQHGVTLSLGLRADKPQFNTKPSFNPAVLSGIGYSTSATPSDSITLEPRVGFNWDISAAGRQQLRGGVGVFQGRTPFVWISNNYGNTGIEQVLKGCTTAACMPAFNPDPNTQSKLDGVAGAVQDVALSDPDFKFPRVLRSTLGYDRELPFGIRATVEALYSKTLEDVYYYNVNKAATGTSPLDGRPTYTNRSTSFGNAYLLSNTTKGNDLTESLQLNKLIGNNLNINMSYAHQKAKSVGDPTSSTAASQWQFGFLTTGDIYTQVLSTSTFQVEHRFNSAITYNFGTGPFTHSIGAFYVAQSGQPYTLLLGGDPNRDGSSNNDLLFVPASYILCPSNATAPTATAPCGTGRTPLANQGALSDFLNTVGMNGFTGNVDRNSLRQPWTRRLDLHYGLGLPQFMGARVQIEADVLNLLNLFDNESGVQRFVSNNTYQPVAYVGQDPTSGKPVYREAATGRLNPGAQFSTANTASRWQGRLGLRVSF
jgi:outer membrane receptor for ferrienterochelin and colicin